MNPPVLTLRFVRNAFTPREGPLETVGTFILLAHKEIDGLWSMPKREMVAFPTGDKLEVYSEVNPACNYVHIYDGSRRVVSWKAASDVDLMFLLPSGKEAYVSLVVHDALQ